MWNLNKKITEKTKARSNVVMVTIHALDKRKNIGTIFPDLSEAFHTLYHDLLFVKLNACDFSLNVMKFFQIFLVG